MIGSFYPIIGNYKIVVTIGATITLFTMSNSPFKNIIMIAYWAANLTFCIFTL